MCCIACLCRDVIEGAKPNVIRILHSGDLHLEAPLAEWGASAAARREDFWAAFETLLALAARHRAHLLLLAGNLFHSPRPTAAAVERVRTGLDALREQGTHTVLLPGSHDSLLVGDSVYRGEAFPGSTVLRSAPQPVPLQVGEHRVWLYGRSRFGLGSGAAEGGLNRSDAEGFHIGLVHEPEGSAPGSSVLPASEIRRWGLDYVAGGYARRMQELQDDGEILGCLAGSPEGRDFRESGVRCAVLATVGGPATGIETLTTCRRQLTERHLDLNGCDSQADALEKIFALADGELLLRLTLTGQVETPLDCGALTMAAAGKFHYLQLQDQTEFVGGRLAHRLAAGNDFQGLLVRRAQELWKRVEVKQRPVVDAALRELLLRTGLRNGGES